MVLNSDDYQQNIVLYVHNTMVITENTLFGKSTASEVIPISLSVFLLYLLYLLMKRYNHCKEVSIYQYKNIAYLGIIIFILIFT